MPLVQGASESARRENVRQLLAEGYSPSQAVAIALSIQERSRSRRRLDNRRAEQTAREVALMRLVNGRRRLQKRLPRQAPPRGVARDYAAAVSRLVSRYLKLLDPLRERLPDLLATAERERRLDTAGEDVAALIERARRALMEALAGRDIEALAREFAIRTSTFQRIQLRKQVRAALGADVFQRDPSLTAIYDAFVAENAALIRSVPTRVTDEVAAIVSRGVANSVPHPELAKEIEKRVGVGMKRAKLIARDQVGKIYGQVNAHRQKAMGVTHFIWRTVADQRVRPEHVRIEGQRFPVDVGAPGEGLPGEPILCRCYMEPDFTPILGAL